MTRTQSYLRRRLASFEEEINYGSYNGQLVKLQYALYLYERRHYFLTVLLEWQLKEFRR